MQLDLLSWVKPCEVIPFPAKHRTGRARRVAEIMLKRKGRSAAGYWRQTIATYDRQLRAAGFSDAVVRRELADFTNAVQTQVDLATGYADGGGDAA
jgi:hypothetical protein